MVGTVNNEGLVGLVMLAAAFGGFSLDNVGIAEALAIRNGVSVAKSAGIRLLGIGTDSLVV
ncbi:hypothetical protein PanWU01x14_008850, partial [Parasponia andersonii]